MNIKQAKEQIKQAVNAYRQKNDFGEYVIPIEHQRPIFLMGAPGIGKTAIMEQIAQELGIGLVTYSMTHHTRQSALGLPFIVHKTYRGEEYQVSEYTMSEIIASVYEQIEQFHLQEGILFLDEVNCVSETLAPSMLQFLQYKIFGRHRVPDGWMVVTAGNPPEYNNSVREFDIVTWDRLKRIDVEPDYDVWKEYAVVHDIHPAVLSYLDIRKGDFYLIETTVDGKTFVTARGWVDLSDMIRLYERLNYPVNEQLIRQYLQNPKIAKSFAVYYDLFRKYRSDYQIDAILTGTQSKEINARAEKAKFDERLSLLNLLLDAVSNDMKQVIAQEDMMKILMDTLRGLKSTVIGSYGDKAAELLEKTASKQEKAIANTKKAGTISDSEAASGLRAAKIMQRMQKQILEKRPDSGSAAFALIKEEFDRENKELKKQTQLTRQRLENMFSFCEKIFPAGQELLILVTELTLRPYAARFIGKYGCDGYFRNNKNLLFYERKTEILQQIQEMDL